MRTTVVCFVSVFMTFSLTMAMYKSVYDVSPFNDIASYLETKRVIHETETQVEEQNAEKPQVQFQRDTLWLTDSIVANRIITPWSIQCSTDPVTPQCILTIAAGNACDYCQYSCTDATPTSCTMEGSKCSQNKCKANSQFALDNDGSLFVVTKAQKDDS